jgi:hypothetical protein
MKLQKTTWVLVTIAVLLGGVVYINEIQRQSQSEDTQSNEKQIFTLKEEDIQALTIETNKETLKFERTGKEDRPWQMKQPEDVPASDASLAFLLNLLVKGKSDRTLTISPEQTKEYGLDKPLAKLDIQLKNEKKHQLILGNTDFEGQSLYAQVDPPRQSNQDLKVILVSKDFQFAIERDLSEWKQQEETPKRSEPQQPSTSETSKPEEKK